MNGKKPSRVAARAQVTAPTAAKSNGQRQPTLLPNELPPDPEKKSGSCFTSGWVPLLRQDWKDIGFLSCPQPVDKATGALASVTSDQVKRNVNWSMQGMAALLYRTVGQDLYSNFGAYVTSNRSFNSAQSLASKNVDTVGFGGW